MNYHCPRFRLNTGNSIPITGFGTRDLEGSDCFFAVQFALDVGYCHIDTGGAYDNEEIVGDAISAKLRAGKVQRKDLFVVSKIENSYGTPLAIRRACLRSIQNLKCDYIDLLLLDMEVKPLDEWELLIQGPPKKVNYMDSWHGMEQLMGTDLVRSIGVANFKVSHLQRLLEECKIKPAAIQIKCHVGALPRRMLKFCYRQRIHVIAHTPLANYPQLEAKMVQCNKLLRGLATFYRRTPAQVLLRYLIDLGVYPIPVSQNKKNIMENYNIFDFTLCDEHCRLLRKMKHLKWAINPRSSMAN